MSRIIGLLLMISGLFLMYGAIRNIQEVARLQAILKTLEKQQ